MLNKYIIFGNGGGFAFSNLFFLGGDNLKLFSNRFKNMQAQSIYNTDAAIAVQGRVMIKNMRDKII